MCQLLGPIPYFRLGEIQILKKMVFGKGLHDLGESLLVFGLKLR